MTFNCRGFAENSYQSLNFEGLIIKAKSLEEECKFFCVSWLVLEGYFWDFTYFTSHVSARTSVSILRSVSHYQHFTWRTMYIVVWFLASSKWIPWNSTPVPPIHCLYTVCTSCVRTVSTLNRHNNTSSGCIWASSGGSFL